MPDQDPLPSSLPQKTESCAQGHAARNFSGFSKTQENLSSRESKHPTHRAGEQTILSCSSTAPFLRCPDKLGSSSTRLQGAKHLAVFVSTGAASRGETIHSQRRLVGLGDEPQRPLQVWSIMVLLFACSSSGCGLEAGEWPSIFNRNAKHLSTPIIFCLI